jgi:transposase
MEKQYLNINHSILYHPTLCSDEKLILAEIVSLDGLRNGCIASDKHFARIINKSRQTVNGIMKKFQRAGLIVLDVKKGIGKKTKLATNFEELLLKPFENQTNLEVVEAPAPVELLDISCRETLQVGVENEDTTCREIDTINTITNTGKLIQEELHNTGKSLDSLVKNFSNQHQDACFRLNELINTDPAQITNPFLIQFQECYAGLYLLLGNDFADNCHIFKSNQELYEIYGFSNFYEVRKDLIFVRENMDRFLRYTTFI